MCEHKKSERDSIDINYFEKRNLTMRMRLCQLSFLTLLPVQIKIDAGKLKNLYFCLLKNNNIFFLLLYTNV